MIVSEICSIQARLNKALIMRISCSTLTFLALALLHSAVLAQTSTYENPVDGKEYTADWETYEPETPKNDFDARVAIENVRLLTSQEDLAKRITVESLATYIESLEADLLGLAVGSDDSGKVLLQVELGPEQAPVHQLAYEGSVSTDLLQAYYERISERKEVPTVLGVVSFQLFMVVRDQSGEKVDQHPE